MILDERLEFADATSVVAAAGTALIGDVVDLGAQTRDVGGGDPLYVGITVDTAIITGGVAGTIEFRLVSDAQAAIAVDGTATVHFATGPIATGAAAAGRARAGQTVAFFALPQGPTYERYLGIIAIVATAATTAGKINAFTTKDSQGWRAYTQGDL